MVLHRPSDQWRGVVGVFGWGCVMDFFGRFLLWAGVLCLGSVAGHLWVRIGNAIDAQHGEAWAVAYGFVTIYGLAYVLADLVSITRAPR
jgi:hypothetical protein